MLIGLTLLLEIADSLIRQVPGTADVLVFGISGMVEVKMLSFITIICIQIVRTKSLLSLAKALPLVM